LWFTAFAVGAGALIAGYFLDPKSGRRRRHEFSARSAHAARRIASRIGRASRYLGSTIYHRTLHRLKPAPAKPAEGRALLDRVESELFVNRSIPHGQLSFEVEDGTVVLRGQLDSPASIAAVEEAVRKIPGVSGVKNLLHLTGTPAPNKTAALRVSARVRAQGGWPLEPPPDVDSER
jgi:hypothetical protein